MPPAKTDKLVAYFDLESFLGEVKSYVDRHGYSNGEVADLVGTDRTTIGRILNPKWGLATVSLQLAAALSDFADLSLDKYIRSNL